MANLKISYFLLFATHYSLFTAHCLPVHCLLFPTYLLSAVCAGGKCNVLFADGFFPVRSDVPGSEKRQHQNKKHNRKNRKNPQWISAANFIIVKHLFFLLALNGQFSGCSNYAFESRRKLNFQPTTTRLEKNQQFLCAV